MSFLNVSGIGLEEAGTIILQPISFTQRRFQKMAIAGETGSGKSTLLQTIAGLVQPSAGQVTFQGKRVIGPQDQLIPGHPGIAYLSQQFELPPSLRVEQVLRYANTLTSAEAATLYEVCRISHLLLRRTNQLSGGERQRIALARLLLGAPELLLLDEPFSNLDMGHKNILKAVIRDIGQELGITLLLISHDPLDTLSWADQVLVMRNGQIIQKGRPRQIYRQPTNEYVAALFGNYNLLTAAQASLVAGLPGIKLKPKQLVIRPEGFKLVAQGNNFLSGTVAGVYYFGSYFELEVNLADAPVRVRTDNGNYVIGDAVFLSVAADAIWYI